MAPVDQPVIPKGSLVLITAANGFIGSNIADQLLNLGYKVRGTTRSPAKNAWLTALFDRKYGVGNFEFVAVEDMEAPNAFDEAVRGASAVIHTATNVNLSPDPTVVIPSAVRGAINALEAAAKEPSVKRFVLTSSSTAAYVSKPNTPMTITVDTWNDEIVAFATRDPPYEPERWYPVYAASKTVAEKEAWKWMADNKPGFVFNTVLPSINFGGSLDYENQGHASTSGFVAALFKGDSSTLSSVPAQYFVDVQDCALLHVAAAILPGVESERIFGFAEAQNGNQVLAILRELYPNRTFPADFQSAKDLAEIVPRERAEQLLRAMGQDGWTSLRESIKRNTEDIV